MSSDSSKKRSGGPSVVIEIGNDWLKMLQAEPARGGIAVSRLHVEKFSASGVDLAQAIKTALKKLKFSRMQVISCLPRQVVNIRMLELPSTDPNEIADMVDLQVGKQTPYSKDEIVSDYKILGSDREGYCRVMLVIVQKGVLRQRFSVLEEAGVDVKRMTVSSEGLLNWCRQAIGGSGKATAVLDIDSTYSDFAVMSRGGMVFTRSILVGANQLVEDYEIWKDKLAREVKQSLEMCRNEAPGRSPVRLVVTGAGAVVEGLTDYLGEQLNLPAEFMDSLKSAAKVASSPSFDEAESRAVSLTPLLGTAMAPEDLEFNLIPDSITLRKGLIQKARSLTIFGMLVMTFLVTGSLYGMIKLYAKKDTLARIEKEIRDSDPAVREVKKMLEIIMVDRERRDTRFTAVNLLAETQKLVPATVTLNQIGLDLAKEKGQATFSGESGSNEDVQLLVAALEKSPLFKDVKYTTKKDEGGGVITFQIESSLEK